MRSYNLELDNIRQKMEINYKNKLKWKIQRCFYYYYYFLFLESSLKGSRKLKRLNEHMSIEKSRRRLASG